MPKVCFMLVKKWIKGNRIIVVSLIYYCCKLFSRLCNKMMNHFGTCLPTLHSRGSRQELLSTSMTWAKVRQPETAQTRLLFLRHNYVVLRHDRYAGRIFRLLHLTLQLLLTKLHLLVLHDFRFFNLTSKLLQVVGLRPRVSLVTALYLYIHSCN